MWIAFLAGKISLSFTPHLEQLWNPARFLFRGNEKSFLQTKWQGSKYKTEILSSPSWHVVRAMETTFATSILE
jgi:hypothetical protein